MRHLNLEGSYYDMGYKYGQILRRIGFKLPSLSQKRLHLGLQCREEIRSFFPEALEELQGISDATGINFDRLCAFDLTQFETGQNCSIFAVTDGKKTLIGRNYDMFYHLKENCESYYTAPQDGYRSLGHTEAFVGREDGINERGLGVAMSGITAYFSPGVAFWIAIRYLLDRCRNVEESIKILEEIPHHATITFLLADHTGKMVVVEASPMKTAVRRPTEDFIVSTNHFNFPGMLDIELYEPPDSRIRYDTIVKKLREKRSELTEEFLMSILSNHEGLVCSHIEEIKLGTLWSVIYNLNNFKLFRAEGHPCKKEYIEDNRLRKALNLS